MKIIKRFLMFKRRGTLGFAVLTPVMFGVLLSKPRVQEDTLLDFSMDTCGWIFFMLYVVLRSWATMYIGKRKDKELQTQGPYSLCRNPLYLGSFCLALSIAFFFESFSLLIAAFVVAFMYLVWVIPAEERVLQAMFGKRFYDYCQQTPLICPSFKEYYASSFIEVNLKGLYHEAKRLLIACLLPFCSEIIMCLRSAEWWPYMFTLP